MTWQTRAACWGMDTEIFFPKRGTNPRRAKAICAPCPVRDECLRRALNAEEYPWQRHGVYGGMTALDREIRFDGKGKRTECINGHLLSEDNVRILANGRRQCIACSAPRPECRQGHVYTDDNTYYTNRGIRCCITCRRDRNREASRRSRAKDKAA